MAVATRIAFRDPLGDHLITSQISAMFLIDLPAESDSVRAVDGHTVLDDLLGAWVRR